MCIAKHLPNIKRFFMRLIYAPGVTPLPLGYTVVLFIILIFNAMNITMVFAYLPQLVKSFGIGEVDIGTYTGIIASAMFASQMIFSFFWGYLGDTKGRPFTLTLACFGSSIMSLLFAFTKDFWWCITCRFLQGVIVLFVATQNMFFQLCDETNKPVAVMFGLSSYATGLVLGPSIGGYMVFMADEYPNLVAKGTFLDIYKVFLPNIFLSIGFAACGFFFTIIHRRSNEYKTLVADDICAEVNDFNDSHDSSSSDSIIMEKKNTYGSVNGEGSSSSNSETSNDEEQLTNAKFTKPRSLLHVLFVNKKCLLACSIGFFFNITAIGFNELYPVWADASRKYNGLGLSVSQIGTSLIAAAILLMFVQPIFLSRTAAFLGMKKFFIISLVIQAMLYPLYPPIALIHNKVWMWVLLCLNIILSRMMVGASFMGTAVFINNSVPKEYSGSANGFGNAIASLGRLFAPLMFGRMFSWSLTNVKGANVDGLGFPFDQSFSFIVMALVSLLVALLVVFYKDDESDRPHDIPRDIRESFDALSGVHG